MDLEKERDEIIKLIEGIKASIDLPLEEASSGEKALSPENLVVIQEQLQSAMSVLQEKADALVEESGMSAEEMKSYVENPSNFSPEEWSTIKQMRDNIDTFKESLKKALLTQDALGKEKEILEQHIRSPRGTRRHWVAS